MISWIALVLAGRKHETNLALHSEFAAKGAEIVYGPLIQESYQMKEFAVRDGDGHVLGFGQAL